MAATRKQTFAQLAREFLGEKLRESKKRKSVKKKRNAASLLLESLKEIENLKGGITDGSINHDHYIYGTPKVRP
ncbi:hypothetical protein HY407_04485 [Candidatus Gottesmanbacteria bacterium]|nr:hypothetical protein [Candidatus Gottesmanbacteria bacterium]